MKEKVKKLKKVFFMSILISLGIGSVNCYALSLSNKEAKKTSITVNVGMVAKTIAPSKEMMKEMYIEENKQLLASK